MDPKHRQRIRYLRTPDGVQLAWAEAGHGPLLVKAANWLTHLEYDLESPVWRHWNRFFADHFHFVRYDERGCGMTDWKVGDVSFDRWVDDLEAVVGAVGPTEPFALLGISQGASACIAYAVKHPERVSHLVLYGAYARGWAARSGQSEGQREYDAIIELIHLGWGKENPAFRELFTSRFIPGGTREQLDWFNELCRKTTTPEIAAQLMRTRGDVDVSSLLSYVRTPTLVISAREDAITPISEARYLAAAIPSAEFVELESKNHILLESEPAWTRFQEVVLDFLGVGADKTVQGHDPFTTLSPRERQILALIAEGRSNAEIAERLSLSEKTIRNTVSNIFDKLGVWTRAQAIVFAHDHGFRGRT